jgi:hypothetical protein
MTGSLLYALSIGSLATPPPDRSLCDGIICDGSCFVAIFEKSTSSSIFERSKGKVV